MSGEMFVFLSGVFLGLAFGGFLGLYLGVRWSVTAMTVTVRKCAKAAREGTERDDSEKEGIL